MNNGCNVRLGWNVDTLFRHRPYIPRFISILDAYLYVNDNPACVGPEEPSVCYIPNDTWWSTEQHDEEISHGQIHDENVRHRLHGLRHCNSNENLKDKDHQF